MKFYRFHPMKPRSCLCLHARHFFQKSQKPRGIFRDMSYIWGNSKQQQTMDARDKLSVRLDPFTANQLTHICDDAGVKMSELVRGILARVVDIITDEAGNIDKHEFAKFFGRRFRD